MTTQKRTTTRELLFRLKPLVPDLVLAALLMGLAVVIRLDHYMTIPVITDETREVLSALGIARGEQFPLTNVSTYIGPIFLYLLAFAFRVFGVSPELPRLFVLSLGALTVGATYWLGRLWANRLAAFLGAGLFTTAATHVWVNSHIANSASTTPLFTTLTIIAMTYALRNHRASAWIVAGLLYGLALQTHPTVILLAPALALWVMLNPVYRRQMRTRRPYLAIGAAVLAYSPVLVHNALTWGTAQSSFSSVTRRTYAFGLPENVGDYANQVVNTTLDIWRAFAAQFVPFETWRDVLQFVPLFYLLLLLVAVVWLFRRGNMLPGLMFVLTPLLLAVFVRNTIFPYDTRYYAFLLPVGYIAIGIFLDRVLRAIWTWKPPAWQWMGRQFNFGALPPIQVHQLVRVLVIVFIAVNLIRVALYPLYALVGVNQFFLLNGPNSSGMLELAQRARAAKAQVWLDQDLTGADYWMCNGVTAGEALAYLLTLNSVPNQTFRLNQFAVTPPQWIAVTPQHSAQLAAHTKLKQIGTTMPPGVHCAPAVIELYQVEN